MKRLGRVKDTEANLRTSFESEEDIAQKAYADFLKIASEVGDQAAMKIFSQSRDVEATHAQLYKKAMGHLMEDRETTYYVCEVCGFVSDGHLPESCPVCGAGKDNFFKV